MIVLGCLVVHVFVLGGMSCKSHLHLGIETHLKVAFGEDYLGID